ncbi:hypothetical protein HNV11_04785 [Spirosoma taeanense]|uniref:Uncharacterized protein n=1 Tax=Spirosoma taeanense TaxID=2735870 RepID=A0A6M5Y6P9_9BACT|nr:hypothetical protein [Spirosoma taeanense]QJW88743.1 hypothetical protein HNV11_04785 [Spirosoma taeanense]
MKNSLSTLCIFLFVALTRLVAQSTSGDPAPAPIETDVTEEDEEDSEDTLDKYFFIGHFGGNINFIDRQLTVNSVYTDVQFNPQLKLKNGFGLRFPIRVYYNNGAGPLQSDNSNRQRIITVDTVTVAPKVRYWDDEFALVYKTENRNLGLNVPVLLTWNIQDNPNWAVTAGLNVDFVWVTNRRYDYQYAPVSADTAGFRVVNTRSQVPIIPPTVVGSVTATNAPVYGTNPFRPKTPPAREFSFSQIFIGFQAGLEHQSTNFNFSLRYSLGNVSTFAQRRVDANNDYNHIIQLIFLEKKTGIQFFGEVRAATFRNDGFANAIPVPQYYFSLAKTIYLAKIKEIFFP